MAKLFISIITIIVLTGSAGFATADPVKLVLHKQTGCMCCDAHADILETEGFQVEIVSHRNLDRFKQVNDIPREFAGCHTMIVDNYIVEGHVPGEMIARLVTEKPDIRGISLPGMPVGTPGMPGNRNEMLDVYVIDGGEKTVFDRF